MRSRPQPLCAVSFALRSFRLPEKHILWTAVHCCGRPRLEEDCSIEIGDYWNLVDADSLRYALGHGSRKGSQHRRGPTPVLFNLRSAVNPAKMSRVKSFKRYSTTRPSAWKWPITTFTRSPALTDRRGFENAIQ